MKTKFVKGDILVIMAALFFAVLLFLLLFLFPDGGELVITVRGDEDSITTRYSLSQNREFVIENNGVSLSVVIEDGTAYVRESNCDNQVCVNSGRISRSGQSIVCAPAGIAFTIESGGERDADAIAG